MDAEYLTIEEEYLVYMFDTGSRTELIDELNRIIPFYDDLEVREIAENVIKKVSAMTEEEFDRVALNILIDFDDDETDEEFDRVALNILFDFRDDETEEEY